MYLSFSVSLFYSYYTCSEHDNFGGSIWAASHISFYCGLPKLLLLGTYGYADFCYLHGVWEIGEVYDLFGITFRKHPDLRRIPRPAPRRAPSEEDSFVRSIGGNFCRVRDKKVGPPVRSMAIFHAIAVSAASAGRMSTRLGIARRVIICSIG